MCKAGSVLHALRTSLRKLLTHDEGRDDLVGAGFDSSEGDSRLESTTESGPAQQDATRQDTQVRHIRETPSLCVELIDKAVTNSKSIEEPAHEELASSDQIDTKQDVGTPGPYDAKNIQIAERNKGAPEWKDAADEFEHNATRFDEVRLYGCHHRNVVVKRCTWSNVTFTACKLLNIVFDDVHLENVHFQNVDFEKVTLRDMYLRDAQWVDFLLGNALISRTRLQEQTFPNIDLQFALGGLRSCARGRRLAHVAVKGANPTSFRYRSPLMTMTAIRAPRKTLLSLPDGVLAKICEYSFPGRTVWVENRKAPINGAKFRGQTKYPLPEWSTLQTYVGSEFRNVPSGRQKNLNFALALLRVNRRLHTIGTPFLYQRTFVFGSGMQACIAFLHDHRGEQHAPKCLDLRLRKDDVQLFERVLGILVHKRTDIEKIFLRINTFHFWPRTRSGDRWPTRIEKPLVWQPGAAFGDFMKQFPRFPLQIGARTQATLDIRGTRYMFNAERTALSSALHDIVVTMWREPRQAEANNAGCCNKKLLEKCCYWNIVEFKPRSFLDLDQTASRRWPEEQRKGKLVRVMPKIMGYLFPTEVIAVVENQSGIDPHSRPRQTRYPSIHSDCDSTTYTIGRVEPKKDVRHYSTPASPKSSICVDFLRVNKKCYALGFNALYPNRFHFDSNPGTCLAFLHDKQNHKFNIRHVTLQYGELSNCRAWKALFNVLVHDRPEVVSIKIIISEEFWWVAPWDQRMLVDWDAPRTRESTVSKGVDAVLKWPGFCKWKSGKSFCCKDKNFLCHIARLDSYRMLDLAISGSEECPARMEFLEALEERLRDLRVERPDYDERKFCDCRQKNIEECSYWKGKGKPKGRYDWMAEEFY